MRCEGRSAGSRRSAPLITKKFRMKLIPISRSRWLELLDNLQYFPAFYSPDWLETYENLKKGYSAGAFEILCKNAIYLFPYLMSKAFILKFLYSNPLSTYGGPVLIHGNHDPVCLLKALRTISRKFLGVLINFDPFNPVGSEDFPDFKTFSSFTHVIDLDRGFKFPENFLRGVKKAKKEGVLVVKNEMLDDFLVEIFSRKGWLDKRIKKFFFGELIARKVGKLYSAVYQDNAIAHIFVVYGKNYAFYHYGISKRDFLWLRPNNLLHHTVVMELGGGIYNLGSSAGLPGVEEFKKRMGAKKVSVKSIYRGFVPKKPSGSADVV